MASARGAVIAAVIGVGVVVAVALSWRLYDYVLELRTAPRDNVQWTMAQLEVDQLNLLTVVLAANETSDLAPLRRRYDIFFSRVDLIARGQVFAAVREAPEIPGLLHRVEQFLAETTPLIDGPDWLLRAELPMLAAGLAEQRQVVREMSIGAVRIFAEHSDQRRQRFEQLLMLTAAVLIGLIALLVTALVFLAREHRISIERGLEAARSRERLAAAIDVALEAIVVVDARGRIIEFNPSAEAVFGYARDAALKMPMGRLLVPDGPRGADRDAWADILDGAGRATRQGRIETVGRRADDVAFPAELSIGAASDESGPIFIAYIRDISERLAAERAIVDARDRALAADRAKSDFIAVISHEMRTPLNGLLGVLDLMAVTDLTPKQSGYLAMAVTSSEILLRHVNDVLDIARIESGNLTLDLAPLDIRTLVADVLEVTRPSAELRGARIRADLHRRVGAIDGRLVADSHRLRQVLLNLVGNATKFAGDGLIEIRVAVPKADEGVLEHGMPGGATLEFSVIDDGPGIALEDQARIFEDFVTLDAGYDRRNTGSGLGLAICRRIVSAMGGTIGVESEPGQGSRFWVRIPLEAVRPEDGKEARFGDVAAARAERRVGRLYVLLVEDNETNSIVLREMLTGDGHRVVEAVDGQDGVNKAAAERFDIILMDISMPGMDGVEATRAIRAGAGPCREAPIIALTAHAMPEERARFAAAGMQDCLTKPIRRETLLQALARFAADMDPPAEGRPEAEAPPEAETPLVDEEALADLAASLPADRLARMVVRFGEDVDAAVGAIGAATESSGYQAETHRLTGSAAVFGAARLHGLLVRCESARKRGDEAAAAAAAAEAAVVAVETYAVLKEFAGQYADA